MTAATQKPAKKLRLPKDIVKFTMTSGAIYLCFAIYLFWCYLPQMKGLKVLFVACPVIGAMGCFVLSRRWVSSFAGSLTAGAVYGFGPFVLSFTSFHPLACLPAAAVPWLFCQAVFFRHNKLTKKNLHEVVGLIFLSILPFVAIGLYFWVLAQPWWIKGPFFPMPKTQVLTVTHLAGFVVPLSSRTMFAIAFYHVPVALIVMGLCMYIASERFGVLLVVGAGFALSFFDKWTPVSPVVWGLIPVMFFSILAGLGVQGLAWSGLADRKWILLDIVLMLMCAALTTILAMGDNAAVFVKVAAAMFWLSVVLLSTLYFVAKASLRWHIFRWGLLLISLVVDIGYGATYIVDSIF